MNINPSSNLSALAEIDRQARAAGHSFYSEAQRRNGGGGFSLRRMLDALDSSRTITGTPEAGKLQELERLLPGYSYNANAPRIPLELLADPTALPDEIARSRRDMTVAAVSGSNYLVGTATGAVIETLAPFSVAMQAGITVIPGMRDNVQIPKETAAATAYWLANESTDITEGQPTLGMVSCSPKMAGVMFEISEQFRRQENADIYLQSTLQRGIGRLIDQAVLAGTGTNGQPTGIINTTGVQTQSGTSLGLSGLVAMVKNARDTGAQSVGFLSDPAAESVLRAREATSGNGFCWTGDTLASLPAYATDLAPASTLICGPWSDVRLLLWGDAQIVVSPTNFAQGRLGLRIMLGVDVVVGNAGAFTVSSSIT
ncbi:hypothetical protein MASR1M60_30640 [Rhodocyclaceae bacterium]